MALAKKPVTGMRDITPAEMQIREYVMNQIKETYKSFGFTQIETPCFPSQISQNSSFCSNPVVTVQIICDSCCLLLDRIQSFGEIFGSGFCGAVFLIIQNCDRIILLSFLSMICTYSVIDCGHHKYRCTCHNCKQCPAQQLFLPASSLSGFHSTRRSYRNCF